MSGHHPHPHHRPGLGDHYARRGLPLPPPHHDAYVADRLLERLRAVEAERDRARWYADQLRGEVIALGGKPSAEPEADAADAGAMPSEEPDVEAELVDAVADDGAEQAKLTAERDEYLALARRVQADFDNYRKRSRREFEQLKRESLGAFLREFLPAFDELDRALKASEKDDNPASLRAGVKLVRENLWKTLSQAGIKEVDALHQPFDPNLHEAMTTVPAPDHPPHTVLEVFQNGYTLDGFVLRPARVVVSAEPAGPETE